MVNPIHTTTLAMHIFKSHYLYFTQQTVSFGIAPKIIRHEYTLAMVP